MQDNVTRWVGENADGMEYLCQLETKSQGVVTFSALSIVHRPLSSLVVIFRPPLVTSSTALVIVVDSAVGWRRWWHHRRIVPLLKDNNGDLPSPLFFFQIDRRSQLILKGTAPYFTTCLNDKKNDQKDK